MANAHHSLLDYPRLKIFISESVGSRNSDKLIAPGFFNNFGMSSFGMSSQTHFEIGSISG